MNLLKRRTPYLIQGLLSQDPHSICTVYKVCISKNTPYERSVYCNASKWIIIFSRQMTFHIRSFYYYYYRCTIKRACVCLCAKTTELCLLYSQKHDTFPSIFILGFLYEMILEYLLTSSSSSPSSSLCLTFNIQLTISYTITCKYTF